MSFISGLVEFKFTILFYFIVFLIVYLNRKKFDVHGKFVYLYRTKIGINFMRLLATKATKLVKAVGYMGVITGFIGMFFTMGLILFLTYKLILNEPGSGGASPVIPGLPIAGTGLVFPLITGWVVIFIIIVVHEFSHGIVAKAHNIKIKHSGIAFFGPILGAFVEPDEKKLAKQKDLIQHSVFAAGTLANFITVLLVLLIAFIFVNPVSNFLSDSAGVVIFSQPGLPAEKAGIENNTIITGINGKTVSTIDDFQKIMEGIGPNTRIALKSDDKTYSVTTTENPDEPSKGYLGVWIIEEKKVLKKENLFYQISFKFLEWFARLLGWLAFLSLNIGLINLLPIFITDGARMLKVVFERIIPNRGKSMQAWLLVNWVSLFSLLILVFLPFFRWLSSALTRVLI